jgi:hypothetical protein
MATPPIVANKKQKTDDDDIAKLFAELLQEPKRALECLKDLHQRLAAVDTKSATQAIDTVKGKSDVIRKRNEILFENRWDLVKNPSGKRRKEVGTVMFDSDSKGNIILLELDIDDCVMSEFSGTPSCPDHLEMLEFMAEHRFYGEEVPCRFEVEFPKEGGPPMAHYSPQISMEQMEAGLADPYDNMVLVARDED